MRLHCLFTTVVALAFGGPAMANDVANTEVFQLGDHVLGGGDVAQFDIQLADNTKAVIGFVIEWDYFEAMPDSSWASDAQAIVTSPTGADYIIGGFTNIALADVPWSFDGPGSEGPGHYGDLDLHFPWKNDPQPKGLWEFSFSNDWTIDPNPNQYNNLTITFFKGGSCSPNFNGDGTVGFDDLLALLAAWGPCAACPQDLDSDMEVGFQDLLALLAAWGPCD